MLPRQGDQPLHLIYTLHGPFGPNVDENVREAPAWLPRGRLRPRRGAARPAGGRRRGSRRIRRGGATRPRGARTMSGRKKTATKRPGRSRGPSDAKLDGMIEEAIVDAYGESEQTVAFYTMIADSLATPFRTDM